MSALYSFGLPEVIAGLMVVALTAYVLTGGADFGGGVWDLLASGPLREKQRATIAAALAPIWEANHVWLIVVVVMLFTAFPPAFSAIAIVLHIPLTILLVGIVLRGSAFVFRSYGAPTETQRRRWGAVFAIASTMTPVFLGICVGALASGRVGDAMRLVTTNQGTFAERFVDPWLSPFPIAVGFFALVLFAFLAAVYLAYGAGDDDLREIFRRRALAAAVAVFGMAVIALGFALVHAERIALGITLTPIGIVVQAATALFAITTIVALWRRRFGVARLAAGAQVTAILWGWVVAQFPYMIPDSIRVRDAAAPDNTLVLLAIGLAIGAAILLPSLRYLYRLFATRVSASSRS